MARGETGLWQSLAGVLPLSLILGLPLLFGLVVMLPVLLDRDAIVAFAAHPQVPGGLALTLFTGIASTILSLLAAIAIVRPLGHRIAAEAGGFLAVPHLAFTVGLSFLIMPAGLLARLLATLFTGWDQPPPWVSVHDPFGLSLGAALVLKETPFLVWAMAGLLNRDDLQHTFNAQLAVARSLGHGASSAWLRVVLPQILQRMTWPLVAVFAYGMGVVDMALVTGPTQPPTLAQLIWTDINDGESLTNARGAAGVLVLTSIMTGMLGLAWLFFNVLHPFWRRFVSAAPRKGMWALPPGTLLWNGWRVTYVLVGLILLVQSVAGHWPFPNLLPEVTNTAAWHHVLEEATPFLASLVLALTTSLASLLACILWFEMVPSSLDRMPLVAATLSLVLPGLVVALGQYRMLLQLGITGTGLAMFMAHALPVSAYVFIMLKAPYRGFDPRWQAAASGLQASRFCFLTGVKWPMLKAPLLSAWAVGFAVSMAQFLPAQLAGAGRFTTLPIEAVTLASGGNRALAATYALALMVLPLLAFVGAALAGRARWSLR